MSKLGTLRDLLVSLLQEHERDGALPTSARFLFYELVQRGQLSKQSTGARRPDQDLHDALTDIREDGRVPWDWINDETRTRRVLEQTIDGHLHRERVALTEEQVSDYNLPVITKRDRRYKDGRPHEAVETEALRQTVLMDILRARLDELLPEPLTRVLERERRQRIRIATTLGGKS